MALTVITGPPCAGKSTYVQAHAHPGDIVIDLDRIAAALTIAGGGHDHPRHIRRVAYRARGVAIDAALRHVGETGVWIIHTDPAPETLTRYAQHGAQVITLDPGYDVVMDRIAHQRPDSARVVASRWYANHEHDRTVEAGPPPTTSRNW